MSVAGTFNYVDWLTMEGLDILVNKLECARYFNTSYNKEYTQEFATGPTVRIPLPQRYTIRNGLGYNPQALDRPYTTVTVDQIFGVDFEWDSAEKALQMERGQERIKEAYLEPAMAQLAQEIDSRCALWAYQNANNIVGILGTDPTTLTTSAQARQRLYEMAATDGPMGLIIPPSVNTSLVPAFATFFNPADAISKQYRKGTIGTAQGFTWHESMSLYSHTAGTWAGAVSVSGGGQSGSSILLNCTNGDTFLKGDVFSIDNVYAVNPSTRRVTTTATDKNFVVTADTTATGSTVTVPISPAIVGPGSQYQNVDALPANAATVTLFPGTTSPNAKSGKQALALNKDAFALVGVSLELPTAVEMKSQTRDPDTGIAVRFVRQWDNVQSRMTNRFDVMIGFGNLYPDNCAVRMLCS